MVQYKPWKNKGEYKTSEYCVCVCVCVCERERERERGQESHQNKDSSCLEQRPPFSLSLSLFVSLFHHLHLCLLIRLHPTLSLFLTRPSSHLSPPFFLLFSVSIALSSSLALSLCVSRSLGQRASLALWPRDVGQLSVP